MERGRRACESKEQRKLSKPANSKSQLFGDGYSTRNLMKKLLLTLGMIGCTLASAVAQGTVAFGNSVLTRIQIAPEPGGVPRNATAADGLAISLWYGPVGSSRDQLVMAPYVASIGPTTPGILINAPSVLALPGTSPNEVVSLQFRAEGNGLCGESRIVQVTLGPTAGPGAVIWQPAGTTGFSPLVLYPCPEPSTLALGVLGCLAVIIRVRKSSKSK